MPRHSRRSLVTRRRLLGSAAGTVLLTSLGRRVLADGSVRPMPRVNRYLQAVAATPLVPIRTAPGDPVVYAKLEFMNPSGSTKDRIARFMLEKAWRRGDVKADSLVVEASSGSTSMSLALAAAQMGLRFRAVMAEGVSGERILNIKAYGGEVELVSKEDGIKGAQARAEAIARETGAYYTRQFENPDNAAAHREGTGREALDQVPGGVIDAVVAGVGTGGTLVGLYQACVERGGRPVPVNARPVDRHAEGTGLRGPYSTRIPGVVDGASRIFAEAKLPQLVTEDVTADEALAMARRLARMGFPVGPSSGLNICAARKVAKRQGPKANVVTVLCDRMDRYYSTELFDPIR